MCNSSWTESGGISLFNGVQQGECFVVKIVSDYSEMVMIPKEIQPANIKTPFSTSTIYYPTTIQDMPDASLTVVKMETSLALTTSDQTL
ncbi:hypothetical protein STEG23_037417 [Scotinomys teguina]